VYGQLNAAHVARSKKINRRN